MAAIQIVPVNVSIIHFYEVVMDFQTEEEHTIGVSNFIDELSKSLQGRHGNKQIEWRDENNQKVKIIESWRMRQF